MTDPGKRDIADFSVELVYGEGDDAVYRLKFGSFLWAVGRRSIVKLMDYVQECERGAQMPEAQAKALIAQWAKELEDDHATA
jgi:hypothetical protein